MLLSEVQAVKALSPISVTVDEIVTLVREVQVENTLSFILATLGTETSLRDEQAANARSSILIIEAGRFIFSRA